MAINILIAGAGQLGSRYLQGLALYRDPLQIWVYDVSNASLSRAAERWHECDTQQHAVEYTKSLSSIAQVIDVAIVATNSDVRLGVVHKILQHSKIRYWIMEKVLAQRTSDLVQIQKATASALGCWVNTPMYLWPLYQQIHEQIGKGEPISASFTGMQGLACNAIHYIDYVARFNDARVSSVDTSSLNRLWMPSKRPGYFEVEGEMKIGFSDGSTLRLTSGIGNADFRVTISSAAGDWVVDEARGSAKSSDGSSINASILRQSELTAPLLETILSSGECKLPVLSESVAQHQPFLEALLIHWNECMPNTLDYVPVT